jgi:hypothetical protein
MGSPKWPDRVVPSGEEKTRKKQKGKTKGKQVTGNREKNQKVRKSENQIVERG